MQSLTLGKFRELTKDLPDSAQVSYHAYDKGLCLSAFDADAAWIFGAGETARFVINPGKDYDERYQSK